MTLDTMILPDLLAISTIMAEAGNQPLEGMTAVGEVIRNRAARKYNSDGSIIGTILGPFQFSCWNHDPTNRRLMIRNLNNLVFFPATQGGRAALAWNNSKTSKITNGAVLYHTTSISPAWVNAPGVNKTVEIADHIFYNEVK